MHHQTRLQIHDLLVRLSVLVFISVLLSSCVPSDPEASSYISTTATCTSDESQMVTEVVNGYCYAREVKVKIADAEGDIYIHDVSGAGGKIAVVASVFSGDGSSQDVFLLIYDTQGNQIGKQEIFSQVVNVGVLNLCDNGSDTLLILNDAPNIEVFRIHPEDASIETISQLELPEMVMADPRVQLLPNGMIVLNGFSADGSSDASLLFYKTDGTFLGRYSDMLLSGGVIYWEGDIFAPMMSYSGAISQPVPIDMTDWTAGEPVDTIRFRNPSSLLYFGDSVYEVTGQGIFLYNESAPNGKQVVDKVNTDLDQVVYDFLDYFSAVSEECFTCFPQSPPPYDEFVILTCSDTHPKDGKTELVMGGFMDPNAALMHAIHQFNITNDEYYISVMDFGNMKDTNGEPYIPGEGGYEKLYPQLMQDIMDGSGPDLMFFGNSGHESAYCCHFEKTGFLLDLSPYLQGGEEDVLGTTLPNILEASMSGDKLYKIPYAVLLEVLFPYQDVSLSSIDTIAEFDQVMDAFPKGSFALNDLTQSELLTQMFTYNYESFFGIVDRTSTFDANLFADLLDFSKKYGWNNEIQRETEEFSQTYAQYLNSGMIALLERVIPDPAYYAHYQPESLPYYNLNTIPLPCQSESVGRIIPEEMIAVTSTTLHPEGAAEFIQFLLGKEIQSYVWGFNEDMPVRKEIFDYIIGDLPYPEDFAEYSKATDKDDYEMWGFVTDNYTQEEIIEDGRLFKPIFLGSNFLYYPDGDMEKIIIEEAAAFFEGQKNAEEVAKIVENRLLLIVAERGGI